MNVLILNWRDPNNPKSGGAELVTMEHAKAWVRAGHNVTWFSSKFKYAEGREIIDGVEVIRRGGSFTVYLLSPFFYFFSRRNFDIVIDEIHGLPFFTPLYVRKPKIAFIHEIAGEIWNYMYPFPISMTGKLLESFYFIVYKDILFWTDAPSTVNELVKKGIKRSYCTAIACPITNQFVIKMPVKEKRPTYLFVSRLVKMKGVEEIIKAFLMLHRNQQGAQLWIVGSGEKNYTNYLKILVKESGLERNVIFYGFVSNEKKLELMGKAHVLLHASVKEGWGLVVLEAASQGTPAVVYNVTGLIDVVKNNITGIVITDNSPQELAKQTLSLLSDKKRYKTFQRNGLIWAKSMKWSSATNESLQLIKRAMHM